MLDTPLLVHVERSGFSPLASLVHLGAKLHGAKGGATDDLDLAAHSQRKVEES